MLIYTFKSLAAKLPQIYGFSLSYTNLRNMAFTI